MATDRPSRARRVGAAVPLILLLLAAIASLLPLIETNAWWIRLLDFPRLQLATVMGVLLLVYLVVRGRTGPVGALVILLALAGLGYHASKLYPYLGIGPVPAVRVAECPPGSSLSVMVANVLKSNETADKFLEIAAEADPDILLVLETDAFWDEHLAPLRGRYAEVEQFIPEEHAAYGMHLFSKRPLVAPEMRFLFDNVTPTVFTGIELEDGLVIQFIGMHPQPPFYWSQPSTMRDAHLLAAALEARASEAPTILAGDLNAVPWERVTRRAIRIGGLLDPRVGRGYYPTVGAESPWVSWPLDQILYEEEFGLTAWEVLPSFGSDHYPVLAGLCHAPEAAELQEPHAMEEEDLQEAETAIKAARLRRERS
jgi:endonuclease/exonuclease/phosphatase (EEP) superfamily protein YafD